MDVHIEGKTTTLVGLPIYFRHALHPICTAAHWDLLPWLSPQNATEHCSYYHSTKIPYPDNLVSLIRRCGPIGILRKDLVDHPLNHKVYYGYILLFIVNVGRTVFEVGLVIATFSDDCATCKPHAENLDI